MESHHYNRVQTTELAMTFDPQLPDLKYRRERESERAKGW